MDRGGVGFFGRKFEVAYGRDNAVWASVAIYLLLLLSSHAAMEKYNPVAPRPRGYNIAVVAAFFAIATSIAAFNTYRIMELVFDPGSGVSPRAAVVFCHAFAAGVAYLTWGLFDRCVRGDAPRTGDDGEDLCGGKGVCDRSVHSALIPLAVLACDLVFFGVALAAAAAAAAASPPGAPGASGADVAETFGGVPDPTGASKAAAGRGVVGTIVAYAKVALIARAVLEICKLVFDYEATLVASVDDPELQADLLACQSAGARKFGTCPDSGSGAEAAGSGAAAGPGGVAAPRTGLVSLVVLRIGVRRALLETAGFIAAFAAVAFVYNLVPDAAASAQSAAS